MPEFYMIFARKINKMPKFYMIFARKIFSYFFLGGGEATAPLLRPQSPTPMRYSMSLNRSFLASKFKKKLSHKQIKVVQSN